jgi:hypothetical protein
MSYLSPDTKDRIIISLARLEAGVEVIAALEASGGGITEEQVQLMINTAITALIDGAPGALDTLNELAAALADDENFAATIATALGNKEDKITAGTILQYWRGDKTWQTLDKNAIGLDQVDNTSDADKPISDATQLALDNLQLDVDNKVAKDGDTMSGSLTIDLSIPSSIQTTDLDGANMYIHFTDDATNLDVNTSLEPGGIGYHYQDNTVNNYMAMNGPDGQLSLYNIQSSVLYPTLPTSDEHVTTKAYVDSKVEDSITDGVTTKAPSQNAVFDALAGKFDAIDFKNFNYDQTMYVAKNGNDSTGTGGQHSPFLTITAAMNAISDASPTKRYCIKVAAGNYTEASLALKANVFIVGEGQKDSVRITGAVSMGPSFMANSSFDNRSGFSMVSLLSVCDFNWNTVQSAAGKLYFNEVTFASTVSLYGYNNAIAQAQFDSCVIFGAMTISGINVGVYTNNVNYANITLNQHPNGGMATILSTAGGYCAGTVSLVTSVTDFNRRCSLFARSFWMNALTVNGASSYADVTYSSLPSAGPTILNGGNVVYINPSSTGANTQLSNLAFPTAVNNPIMPAVTSNTNLGDWGKQWNWTFSYVHGSSGSDCYVISYPSSYAPDSSGREVGIYADGAGLQTNVNGGNITLGTSAVSGTGIRGKVQVDARELDMTSSKITNLADGTASSDAVNKGQLDGKFNNPTGTVADYIAGDGSIQPFPTIATASNLTTEVYNKSGSQINKFQVVYINGGQGNLPAITLAQGNSEATSSKTYGVAQADISNMSNGYVLAQGRIENIDTAVYGGTEGTSLWLSPTVAGGVTITKPSAPDHMVFVGTIVRSHPTQGVVEVKIQNGFELQELHNVAINGSLANNDTLLYDSATQLWKNSSAGSVVNKLTKGTKTIFCIDNGDFATGQAAIDAASPNDIIIFGTKAGGWGDLVIPAGKTLSLKGLQAGRSPNMVQVGSITFSPTTGANILQNELYIDSLYIYSTTADCITHGGTAPSRIRISNCYINCAGAATRAVVFSNTHATSSSYLYDNIIGSSAAATVIQSSIAYARAYRNSVDGSNVGITLTAGTFENNLTNYSINFAGNVANITGGTFLCGYSLISNTGANSSGVAVSTGAVFASSYNSFSIPTGTGYCVRGTGVHVYGSMTFANSVLAAYNVKVQNTLTNVAYTTAFTLTP